MSIKDLFTKRPASFENVNSGSSKVESKDLVLTTLKRNKQFIPNIDFSSASNFAKFGSAELYYKTSIERVYDDYPYDGSRNEKLMFELSSSYLDRWVFNNKYPKSTGYIIFSYGGWGTLDGTKTSDGYGIPTSLEFIYPRGNISTDFSDLTNKPLWKTFDKGIVYDADKNRTNTFILNLDNGFTVEFWLKKNSFDVSKTEKEVILDLWNGELSSSSDYGRFTLELSGTGPAESGRDTFRVSLQSGVNGFFNQPIGSTSVTTSSLGNWKHYALSFVSAAAGVTSRLYVDGALDEQKNLGSNGLGSIGGLFNGYIGALRTSPSSSNGTHTQNQLQYGGKLSASLDEFRFWKTRRTSEQIYNNWHRDVGGGTNTDDANVTLGLYYKFNEGVVGSTSSDSIVLDYSGRVANGTWTGYAAGARNTGSAFLSSSHAIVEKQDPIIRSNHPSVVSVKAELIASGSEWDLQNTTNLYFKTVPDWIKDEDEDQGNNNVKKIYQIISSYFDTLYSQITAVSSLKDTVYPLKQGRAIPFAKKLLEGKGFITNDILLNTTLLEKIENIDDQKRHFEKDVDEIKNLIYTNLYNNLDSILKSKGTEKSIRNTLRCFGIDDELVKLNVYTDGGEHYFTDKYRQTSLMKKYISFFKNTHFDATIFQTSSVANSFTYITGSDSGAKEINSAFTSEVNVILPETVGVFNKAHFKVPFTKSSIFGMHEASDASGDYTWDSTDVANFQVYAQRDEKNLRRAKFVLETYDQSIVLTSSFFPEVYSNQNWNLAVRVKPDKYPFQGNIVETTSPTYQLEFYGVNHAFGTVQSEFLLTSSLNNASGTAFLTKSKRFYAGAHRTNFTGSVLNRSDIKLGGFRFYLDHVSNESIKQHNLDPTSFGLDNTYKSPTMFSVDMGDKHILSSDLIGINWDFETVTTSDVNGQFIVEDVSSGSSDTRYGWIDNVSRVENRGLGFGFPTSNTAIQRNEIVFANKKQQPEIAHNSEKVVVEDDEIRYFIEDEDVSDNFYSLEKSMSQVISDEMIKMISSVVEFNNLIGKAVDRYRPEYKNLNVLRRLFYEKVEEDPDFDKFTRYYKWIDSSISAMVSQLFPMSARSSKQVSDVVESHILERSKYRNKLPTLKTFTATESPIKGSSEIRYGWKFGHAPIDGDDNKNQVWQKLRKERDDIAEREIIRKVLITEREIGDPINLAKADLTTYQGSTFALRRLSRPYRISQDLEPPLHGGINYPPKKDRDVILHLAQRHGEKGNYGQPLNVVAAGLGTGNGILQQQFSDTLDPNLKKRVHLDVYAGRYSDDQSVPGPSDVGDTYKHRITELELPVTIISQSVNSGYNAHVVDRFDSGSIITNIHSDTVSPTNHIPMQGPFAETWVGGHQHRHVPVNRLDTSLRDDDTGLAPPNNLDNKYTRPEAWMLKLGDKFSPFDGALGIVGPDYGGPYPDPARKVAVYYREERAKRPVNIKNIQYTTGSRNLGNYKENYELISAGGKLQNNLYLRKNPEQSIYLPTSIGSILPETTHPMSLFGQAPFVSGNVFGTHHNNRQPDTTALTIISPIVGQFANGLLTSIGATVFNFATGSFGVFGRAHAIDGKKLTITQTNGTTYHFFVNTGAGSPAFNISTGSSNTIYWNNLSSSINANTDYNATYSVIAANDVFSQATYQFVGSTTSTKNYISGTFSNLHFNDGSSAGSFSLACYFHISSSIGDGTIMHFSSSDGSGTSRDLVYNQSNKALLYRVHFDDSGTQRVKNWHLNLSASDGSYNYLDKWTHLVISHTASSSDYGLDNSDVSLAINGTAQSWNTTSINPSVGSLAGNETINKIARDFSLFNLDSTTTDEFLGGLDEVAFWNTNLSTGVSGDAETLYNSKLFITASQVQGANLKAWYRMGDGDTSTVIKDRVGSQDLQITDGDGAAAGGFVYVDTDVTITKAEAVFSLTSSVQGASHNATTTANDGGLGFTDLANIGGGDHEGATHGDTLTINTSVFELFTGSVYSGGNIGVSSTGSNTQYWNKLSASIKTATVFDTININYSSGQFGLTSSLIGAAPNSYAFSETGDTFTTTTFAGGVDPFAGDFRTALDVVIPVITSSITNTVISSRFSAPGGIDTSPAYLDVYSREYSVYNNINFRNLSVRGSGSGESGTIRVDSQASRREGLRTLLSRHSGKFGIDSQHGTIRSEDYASEASFNKMHRNVGRRPTDASTIPVPVLNEDHNNAHMSSLLPRSDFQYSWVTSSLGSNYSYKSGKQRIYGYADVDGMLSSSVDIGGESGHVAAINFPTASEIFGV